MLTFRVSALLTVVVAASLGLSTAHGATFDNLGPYFSFHFGDGGGIPEDVTNVTGQETSPDGQFVKLFGNLGPIDGARFSTGFTFSWGGYVHGPINPGDYFLADLDFDVTVTGGSLGWSFYCDLSSYEGGEFARILTDVAPLPESGHLSTQLQSTPFTQPGNDGNFAGRLHIEWTGYAPTDTFTINIPQNSVDITYIPEPASLSVVGIGTVALLRRRR